jgi:hypothetical protein
MTISRTNFLSNLQRKWKKPTMTKPKGDKLLNYYLINYTTALWKLYAWFYAGTGIVGIKY